jgi:hypothetical protein
LLAIGDRDASRAWPSVSSLRADRRHRRVGAASLAALVLALWAPGRTTEVVELEIRDERAPVARLLS